MSKVTVTAIKQVVQSGESLIFAKATPGDNVYVPGGVQLDLTPGKILDPSALGINGPSQVPLVAPGIFQESMGGYYAQVVPATGSGAAGLSTFKLQFFAPGGAEIGAGAYPAQIAAGQVTLAIVY